MNDTFGSIKGLFRTARATLFGTYKNRAAEQELANHKPASHGPLVQLNVSAGGAKHEERQVERV